MLSKVTFSNIKLKVRFFVELWLCGGDGKSLLVPPPSSIMVLRVISGEEGDKSL